MSVCIALYRFIIIITFPADVEAYIRMSGGLESTSIAGAGVQENPQLFRIRQHFEKKNKKHSQETELLQVSQYLITILVHL
jgi:hypothetical protein